MQDNPLKGQYSRCHMHFQRVDCQRHLCLGCDTAADLNLVPVINRCFCKSPVIKHLIYFIRFIFLWSVVVFT